MSRFAGTGNASTNAAGFRFAQHDGPFICWSARHTAMLYRFVPPGKRGRHNIAARGQLSCRSANIVIFGKRAHGAWALNYNRSEEHKYEIQSLMHQSIAVHCLKKKKETISHFNSQNECSHT